MSTPPAGSPIQVVGTWLRGNGDPETGTISIRPLFTASGSLPTPRIVTMSVIKVPLDQNGSISVDLIPSDDPGWMLNKQIPYKIWVDLSGSKESYYVYVVPPAPVDLGLLYHYDRASIAVPQPVAQVPSIQGYTVPSPQRGRRE